MPVRRDINFNAGFTGCEDRMAILRNATVPRKLDDFTEIEPAEIDTDMYVYVDNAGKSEKIKLGNIIDTSASQPDWDEDDEASYSYIRNKPDLYLKEDLISLYNIGGVKAGDIFEKGTSLYDIIRSILSAIEPTEGIRFGVINEIPEWSGEFITNNLVSIEEYLGIDSGIGLARLLGEGLSLNFKASNQFYVLAVPSNAGLEVSEVLQEGLKLNFVYLKGVVKSENAYGNIVNVWDVCLPTVETFPDQDPEYARTTTPSNGYTITYKFKEVKESN